VERGEELIERIKVAGAGLNRPDSGVTLKVEATMHRDKLFGLLLPIAACTMLPCETAAAAKKPRAP